MVFTFVENKNKENSTFVHLMDPEMFKNSPKCPNSFQKKKNFQNKTKSDHTRD